MKNHGRLFIKAVSENSQDPAALFGLALILADDSSSYFDLIGAWDICHFA